MNTNQGDGARRFRGRRGTVLAQWVSDLRLGVRLAIGGGRTSKTGIARLVLGTVGIGLAVGVLLVGSSAGPMYGAREDRDQARAQISEPVPGVDPLYVRSGTSRFHDLSIDGTYLRPSGPNPPLPPGVSRLPADGEILLSPALAELLASPEGELLRPRFPQRVAGTIDPHGVTDGGTLSFYAGDDSLGPDNGRPVYGYGYDRSEEIPSNLVILISVGTVVLLVPVFVFIATSTRIAGAERDRRLAALRLVGADGRQARRIAAAESLVSAVTGLAFGIGLFLLFRAMVGNFPILGVRPYPSDVSPPWPLVVLVVVLVPGLAVLTAQVALRRTIIEPLGVVRRGRAVRRRLLWRLVPAALGPVLLLSQLDNRDHELLWLTAVVAGSALLLIGIPALLPWLLERAVARLRGGPPAVQLAIRRLQLDSGTPARVVGGVAVVLAGAIALESVLAAQTARYDVARYVPQDVTDFPVFMYVYDQPPEEVGDRVRAVPGVRSVITAREFAARSDSGEYFNLMVVDCDTLRRYAGAARCADGDVFRSVGRDAPAAGSTVTVVGYDGWNGREKLGGRWTLPAEIGRVNLPGGFYGMGGSVLVTPGAVRGVRLPEVMGTVGVELDHSRPDVLEQVRNAVGPYGWRVSLVSLWSEFTSSTVELFLTIRGGLLGGALFTLLLAGISMLVLALEQVRERRRALAALAATGVPTRTLARSLLWQNTVPVLLAVAIAVLTGFGLAMLVFRLLDEPFQMDWPVVALFSGIAAVLVLLVTALTLPTLRSATRLAALRSE